MAILLVVLIVAGLLFAQPIPSRIWYFWQLIDTPDVATPNYYTGHTGKMLAVNSDGTELEFTNSPTLTNMSLTGFLDMAEITAPPPPATDTLRLYTEDIQGFSFYKYLDSGGMKRQLLRDSMILVYNNTGSPIVANRVVYATGSFNNFPTVALAKSSSTATMPAIGVTIEDIANGAYGRVMQVGLLENINTSALAVGNILYVHDTVAGLVRITPPTTPALTQEIGTVLVDNATTGAIQIIARGLTGDEYGTAQNSFSIGDGTAGDKTLTFNAAADGSIVWDGTQFDYGVYTISATTGKFGTFSATVSHLGTVSTCVWDVADGIELGTDTTGFYVATITDAGNNTIITAGAYTEQATVTLDLNTDGVDDTHIDWGTGANQVGIDDIPTSFTETCVIYATATGELTNTLGFTWDEANYALHVGTDTGGGNVGGVYIYSNDGTNKSQLWNTNSTCWYQYDEGAFNIKTLTTNAQTKLNLIANGTGIPTFQIDGATFVQYLTGWNEFRTLPGAEKDWTLFQSAIEGETKEAKIYGYRTGDSSRSLEIGVGVDAADTASFDGVTNYLFDGTVTATTGDFGTASATIGNFGTFSATTGNFDTTLTLPDGTDPDVSAAGQISADTDDNSLRGYGDSVQFLYAQMTKTIQFTIAQPDDLDENDNIPIWSNESGFSFIITSVKSWCNADDATFVLFEKSPTDFTDEITIASVTISTDGTSVYYDTTAVVAASGTIDSGNVIVYDPSTSDVTFIKGTILGYFDSDVN